MKTKETSMICRKCGGNGKPSKVIMNYHNIQTLSKEFETKLLDCIKCESCGHSWIPKTSTREQAIEWWKSINGTFLQQRLGDEFCKKRVLPVDEIPLTGREIEEIWRKETLKDKVFHHELPNNLEELYYKPNKKQYSQEEVDRLLDQQAARTTAQIIGNVLTGTNSKQFKTFDEDLFRVYINKFSEEDKLKAFKTFKTQISDMLYKFAEIVDDSYRPATRDNMNAYMAIPEFKKQEDIE